MDDDRLATGAKARAEVQEQVDRMRTEAGAGHRHLQQAKDGCRLLDAEKSLKMWDFLTPRTHTCMRARPHTVVNMYQMFFLNGTSL